MKWRKLGLVYHAPFDRSWKHSSALAPTPLLLDDRIRVYAGFRDPHGVSRIGYVDVDRADPTQILTISRSPVLDIGIPGCFDDNGVNLGDIVRYDQNLYMFYVGYQPAIKAKFLAFSGLAISTDHGLSFKRLTNTPILDRSPEAPFIRCIHSIHQADDGFFDIYYSAGHRWQKIDELDFPYYQTNYMRSPNLFSFPAIGQPVIIPTLPAYRAGRARFFTIGSSQYLYYTVGSLNGSYILELCKFEQNNWVPQADPGITLSESGFDNIHLCYPAVIHVDDKYFMFYNGNKMGYDGFGVAILESP